jgi:sulfite exporter TauE/SafE
MCGGFYLIAGRNGRSRQLPYLLGKTVTYAVLGAAVGAIGATASLFVGARTVLTIAIGTALIVAGLMWIGVIPKIIKGSPVSRFVATKISRSLERTGPMAPFALGLANGLLPCGLLYGALGIAASTASVTSGAMTMAVFGLATVPGLALFGILARKIGEPLMRHTHLIGGIAMIVFGVITLMRAVQASGGHMVH